MGDFWGAEETRGGEDFAQTAVNEEPASGMGEETGGVGPAQFGGDVEGAEKGKYKLAAMRVTGVRQP